MRGGHALPKGQTFAIVGVNNGLANTTNPCLKTQLTWAGTSRGGTGQPLVALHVNTANPGKAGSWWPTSNTLGGTLVANPYGECTSESHDEACSYMYGYAKAYDDANIRGISNPASYMWWLDVETGNSWSTDTGANRADLEGMAAFFASSAPEPALTRPERSGPRSSMWFLRRATCTGCRAGWPVQGTRRGEAQWFGRPADRGR